MIKIDLDTRHKGKFVYELNESIEVGGETGDLAHEIYTVLKAFEEDAPKALYVAVDKLVTEHEGRINK